MQDGRGCTIDFACCKRIGIVQNFKMYTVGFSCCKRNLLVFLRILKIFKREESRFSPVARECFENLAEIKNV